MNAPFGVILAGGQGRRMGGTEKGLLSLGGRRLLDHACDRLEPQVAKLALNTNADPALYARAGLPIIPDTVKGFAGPLAGVLAGLDWAHAHGGDHIVTVAVDTPFFPPDLVPRLILAGEDMDSPIVLAASREGEKTFRHPTFGLWPVALREDLRTALEEGVRKVVEWTDRHGAARAVFPVAGIDPFFNVNTPEDLARAETVLSGAA